MSRCTVRALPDSRSATRSGAAASLLSTRSSSVPLSNTRPSEQPDLVIHFSCSHGRNECQAVRNVRSRLMHGRRALSPVLLLGAGTGEATCGSLYLAGYLRRGGIEAFVRLYD